MKIWKSVIAGAAFASLSGVTTATAADLTVGAFGGIWERSLRECVVDPFEAETGKSVEIALGATVQWMNQITASPNNPPLDIVYMPTDIAFEMIRRGLAQKFTEELVPNMKEVTPYFAEIGDGYGVVHNYGAMGIIYNKETVTEPPASWEDFIAATLEGKWVAAMPSINYPGSTSVLWNLAELRGGGIDNIDPGISVIKEMQDTGNLEFWADPNQVLNGLQSGEFDIAMYWDGRAWAFIDEGNTEKFNYINPAPGSVAAMTWIQVVKNADPLAWEFANFALRKEVQGCFGSATRYGVGNGSAEFNETVAHQITRFDELTFPPFREIGELQNDWIETWNKEIGR